MADKGRVLLVDDEPLILEELQESLELEGFVVEAAGSVAAAIDACHAQPFDAIVSDLKMPNEGGLELLQNLSETLSPTPVIVVSGHASEECLDEARDLGASACFTKPVDVDELADTIEGLTKTPVH